MGPHQKMGKFSGKPNLFVHFDKTNIFQKQKIIVLAFRQTQDKV